MNGWVAVMPPISLHLVLEVSSLALLSPTWSASISAVTKSTSSQVKDVQTTATVWNPTNNNAEWKECDWVRWELIRNHTGHKPVFLSLLGWSWLEFLAAVFIRTEQLRSFNRKKTLKLTKKQLNKVSVVLYKKKIIIVFKVFYLYIM